MKAPSRSMPAAPERGKLSIGASVVILLILLAASLYATRNHVGLQRGILVSVTLYAAFAVVMFRRRTRIRKERLEESICSFSRLLPARGHDTWVVRAVYEELSRECGLSLRPTDNVKKFLGIWAEDADDIAARIAHRARRSLENTRHNPMFNRTVTVADWITFFEHQPKLDRAK